MNRGVRQDYPISTFHPLMAEYLFLSYFNQEQYLIGSTRPSVLGLNTKVEISNCTFARILPCLPEMHEYSFRTPDLIVLSIRSCLNFHVSKSTIFFRSWSFQSKSFQSKSLTPSWVLILFDQTSTRAHVTKFCDRLRLICTVLRASKFFEIVIN